MAYGNAALVLSLLFVSVTGIAATAQIPKKSLNPDQVQKIQQHQRSVTQNAKSWAGSPKGDALRPFSELEEAGYLFFSSDLNYDSKEAKRLMAKNLPPDVQLVIFTSPGSSKARIVNAYKGVIDPSRLKVVEIDDASDGFWTRDGFPVPVWNQDHEMDLVDARYFHGFEPDRVVSDWFASSLRRNSYYFEGGNFVTNDLGDCLTIDNDLSSDIPDSMFVENYGCKKLLRFPHEKGIGHADESMKFLNSTTVITDSANYERTLKAAGYTVVRVPRPNRKYETYINSLLVNGTIYVPIFNQANDDKALQAYRDAGLKVVPIETISLANNGMGSIHCITMTYPKVPFEVLQKRFKLREL